MTYKIVMGACLISEAAANFMSPGLNKCLDLQSNLSEDGDRETAEEMMKHDKTNVQLYTCHGEHNQHFNIVNGQFRSQSMKNFCLTAAEIKANADVHLEKCEDGKETQQWDLTGDGYVKVTGSSQCLDVKAAKKDDGSYEEFDEIKQHKTVNVHLYNCHDVETHRVNQLWEWAPWRDGAKVGEKVAKVVEDEVVEEWEVRKLGLSGGTPVITMALASAIAVGLFSLGALMGKRVHGAAEKPLASLAEE